MCVTTYSRGLTRWAFGGFTGLTRTLLTRSMSPKESQHEIDPKIETIGERVIPALPKEGQCVDFVPAVSE